MHVCVLMHTNCRRGKVWFSYEAPRNVIEKASFEYPIVSLDNNLIVVQIMGPET
jgi:hypothetical protein